jgi:ribosomal protein S27E
MKLQTMECPNCGSNINFAQNQNTASCLFCGSSVSLKKETSKANESTEANTKSLFYYTTDGSTVSGPVVADQLWEYVDEGQLKSDVLVCMADTESWILFSNLPDSVFSAHIIKAANQQNNNLMEAEQLFIEAQTRLIECQADIQAYGEFTPESKQVARDGLEFIEAALELVPNNPNYLNMKALLLTDGLGQTQEGLKILQKAALNSPSDIQIKQNLREVTQQSENALPSLFVILLCGLLFIVGGGFMCAYAEDGEEGAIGVLGVIMGGGGIIAGIVKYVRAISSSEPASED